MSADPGIEQPATAGVGSYRRWSLQDVDDSVAPQVPSSVVLGLVEGELDHLFLRRNIQAARSEVPRTDQISGQPLLLVGRRKRIVAGRDGVAVADLAVGPVGDHLSTADVVDDSACGSLRFGLSCVMGTDALCTRSHHVPSVATAVGHDVTIV